MAISVTRGPVTTGDRYDNEHPVRFEPEPGVKAFPVYAVTLKFFVASGGGLTDVHVSIDADSFQQIAQAMMNVDPDAAVKAFGSAMVTGCQCGLDPELYR